LDYAPERQALFSGDQILPDITPNIGWSRTTMRWASIWNQWTGWPRWTSTWFCRRTASRFADIANGFGRLGRITPSDAA